MNSRFPPPPARRWPAHLTPARAACVWMLVCACALAPLALGREPAPPAESQEQGIGGLNVRLSTKPIHPPPELVRHTVPIPDIAIARPMVGPPSRAAILEDDTRHRVAVLSLDDNDMLTAYVLDDFTLDTHLPALRAHIAERGCAHDRMAITGGLGCVALCLKDILEDRVFAHSRP